jgi:glycosyltransferase involved in cell wall biosynthesis
MPSEFLISNDSSTDETKEILDRYAQSYPDLIKVYHQPVRLGITKNKNFILSKCQGEYITWLDGDARFHPRKLEWEMDALQKFPEARIIFSNVDEIDGEGKFIRPKIRANMFTDDLHVQQVNLNPHMLYIQKPIAHHRNELIHKDVLEKIGLFDETLILWQDYDYRIRMYEHFSSVYLPCTLQDYRIYDDQTSVSQKERTKKDVQYLHNKFDIKSKSEEIQENWPNWCK